ncbi:MAG: phage tail protein [Comamonadaceae bacterium]|nr:phage tail protein [Comamonadaceae bacterium]
MADVDRSEDPYAGFLFSVEVSPASLPGAGQASRVGGFSDVSGLQFENEVETLRVGGVNDTDVMLPGPARFPTRLVLKRGLADRSFFWSWYLAVLQGRIVRRELTVSVRDPRQQLRQSWTFRDACPVKWTGPDLHAATSAVGFESVELIHRGLQR